MQKERSKEGSRPVRRLIIANLLALFALIFITVVALWALGLLGSIFAFIF